MTAFQTIPPAFRFDTETNLPPLPDESILNYRNLHGKLHETETKASLLLTAQTHAEGSVDPSSSVLELSGQGVQAAGPLFGL